MRRSVSWAIIAACAALVGLLAYGLASSGTDTSIAQALRDGKRPDPPELEEELPVLGAAERTGLPSDYEGKVVLVNIWASWCGPCKDELPLLQRTHEDIEGDGGLVLGVNTRNVTDEALATVARYELTFPNLRDRDAVLARKYGAFGYPETFVIDRQGRVAAARQGPVTQEWLDRTLPPLLAETA